MDLANKFSGTNSSQNNNSWGYNQNPYSGFWWYYKNILLYKFINSILLMESQIKIDPAQLSGSEKLKNAVTCPICLLILTAPIYRCD